MNLALLTGAPIFVAADVLEVVERNEAPPDIDPAEWRLAGLRERSVGSAALVAEIQGRWQKGWKKKAQ